ncbi:two-component system sensor histidine kinase NtrB [Thermincola ferriacetica]
MPSKRDGFNIKDFYYYTIECSSTGIVAINNDEDLVIFNEAAENIFGVSAREVLYRPFSVLQNMTGNTDSLLLSTLHSGSVYEHVEAVIESASGPINVMAYTDLVKNSEGQVIGACLSLRDITPQKQLEEQMYQTEKFSAIGELAAGIAHEVRNPLTSVQGFLQLFAQNTGPEDPKKAYLEIMQKEIDRANAIVKQFLLLAKPVLPIKKGTAMDKLIEEVVCLLQVEAGRYGVEIQTNYAKGLPLVAIDREQIKQVLLNICKNGIYAMPNGGLLSIETEYEAVQNKVHVIISDTGQGIDPFTLEKIFDPFFTTRADGTGLGLTVSYKIVQNHEGKIEVWSEVGKGTTFRVILPLT